MTAPPPVHQVIHDTLIWHSSTPTVELDKVATAVIDDLRRAGYEIERTRWDQR